ncbi:ABC transporter ATP-binding protein [Coralliovum pocilloporae]|uniref:ABC transporter ATP-binding protein n=1 Tax=Coralliovum pocilloporae TaxID=3066369 RepID=UPI003307C4DB
MAIHEHSWGEKGTAGVSFASGLTFEGVEHAYEGEPSLKGIDLDIAPGEIVSLLGHSGCGKTTLLRIAAGIERPSSGRVLVDGVEIAGGKTFVPPENRGIGLMFQDFALFPHLTVLQNVTFGLKGLSRHDAQMRGELALERVGLTVHKDDYPHALSGGEQQRVALARAVAPRPSILLMDEPFSGLDQRLRDSVRDETLAVLREMRATCILVTHDPEEALLASDRIVLMRSGQIVQSSTPEDMYKNPKSLFAARFFSPMNEIEGWVSNGVVRTAVGYFPANDLDEGAVVTVGIRPQAVKISAAANGPYGRVISRRFAGEIDHVNIAVSGLDKSLVAHMRAGHSVEPGTDVRLEFDSRDVVVFPAMEK